MKSYLERVRSRNSSLGDDFYPTPPHATYELLRFEDFPQPILEPACGDGAISQVLIDEGYKVDSSDLVDRGYGKGGVDFLKSTKKYPSIITNPPFSGDLTEAFVSQSLKLATRKIAIYCRLQWISGSGRRNNLARNLKIHRVIILGRIKMKKEGQEKARGLIDYVWLIWDTDKPYMGTKLFWGNPSAKK